MSKEQKQEKQQEGGKIFFYQGVKEVGGNDEKKLEIIKTKLVDLFNIKNINFLFGAGVSNNAIPTMNELQEKVQKEIREKELIEVFLEVKKENSRNLEEILEILYSGQSYFEKTSQTDNSRLKNIKKLIEKIENTIFEAINIDCFAKKDVMQNYKNFYQKVMYRNKELNQINVFTTNNDLFNEMALDSLNIDYNNGFGGGLIRSFNPARFEYIFSKRMDESMQKYEPINHMVYLYKLHGSINWIVKSNDSFFDIQEISIQPKQQKPNESLLIYPTPLKESKSLTSPYTDMIREFQKKLSYPHSVLFIIGYSFSDEHINSIIYRALASNASLSIVVFADKNKIQKKICEIDDRRIYTIYGKEQNNKTIHYFDYIVENFIPHIDEEQDKEMLERFIKALKQEGKINEGEK
ncbi:SIR2 family protein [Campylobacter sp.]|uniref:SIR2 family protein n=1 Tax=Campylobacter sp. TaxID=205 RepID=UPI0025C458A5|nr:SIR2 family protein [Campylobacter sp.]